jgi:hypothetical protein
MFAGVHKHSQSRHATAEGIETADEITGERGRGGEVATTRRGRWWSSNKRQR